MLKDKKSWIIPLLVLVMSLALSACGSGNSNNNSSMQPEASENPIESIKPSATPEPTPTASADPTESSSSATVEPPSQAPSEQPEETPVATDKPSKTATPSVKPSATVKPTRQPSVRPTVKPTQQPSQKPSAKPTVTPTPTSTPTPTPLPTRQPSQQPTEKPNTAVTVQDIVDKITADLEFVGQATIEKAAVPDFYNGIDPDSLLEEGVFQQASFMISASEFSVVKLKSADQYEEIKEAFEFRAAAVQKTFEEYLPDQYELAQNYKIVQNGNYVLFCISSKQDEVVDIFNGFFKK